VIVVPVGLMASGWLIDRNGLLFYTLLISVLEVVKFTNGQPFLNGIRNVSFSICSFLIEYRFTRFAAFFLIALDVTETISWFYTKQGFNVQMLMALDLGWATTYHRDLIWTFLALTIVLIFLVVAPFPKALIRLRPWYTAFFGFSALILGFDIFQSFAVNLDPFKNTQDIGGLHRRIEELRSGFTNEGSSFAQNSTDIVLKYLLTPIQARVVNEPPKRNLIILELESLEYELLGVYNQDYPAMLPFLSKFVRQGTYFRNVISQPYTTWSVASLFGVQCNLPLLLHHVQSGDQGKFHLSQNIRCLGDYLDLVGYHLFSYQTSVFVGQFKDHMKMHKYEALDFKNHRCRRDWDLFAKLRSEVLPGLKNSTPFVLHIANADCHAIPKYYVDRRCENRMASAPAIVRSFDCVDQILEKFFDEFEKSAVFATTDLIMYGDHVLMEGNYKQLTLHPPRSLVLTFPYHEQKEVVKPTSIYDIAPTLMSLLGIEYSPIFPFGADLFSNSVGRVPTLDDFQTIYDMFTTEMSWDRNITCWNGTQGFCTYARS
jgi:hypothetical protein